MLNHLKIAVLSENKNVWFIRAEKGRFAKNFRAGGLIAIGHLEKIFEEPLFEIPSEEDIRARLLKNNSYSEYRGLVDGVEMRGLNRAGHNILSQIKRFANDIKQGDLIVTRNENDDGYSFGICSNDLAFIDRTPVRVPIEKRDGSAGFSRTILDYGLRKTVIWGPSISRAELPGAVRKATSGQQTVTSLNTHKDKIYHLIYPFFTDGESLFFSNKIKTTKRVNAQAIGKLFQNVALIEHLSNILLEGSEIDIGALSELIAEQLSMGSDDSVVTCQAEFMSPGDMWCRIPLAKHLKPEHIIATVLACLLLTGQVSAEELRQTTLGNSTPTLTANKIEAHSIFEDKYVSPSVSPRLKAIAKAAESKVSEPSDKIKAKEIMDIKNSLGLSLTNVHTDKLEEFDFGISTLEIGRTHEDN